MPASQALHPFVRALGAVRGQAGARALASSTWRFWGPARSSLPGTLCSTVLISQLRRMLAALG